MKTSWVVLVCSLAACGGGVSSHDLVNELRSAECDHAVQCNFAPDKASCEASTALNSTDVLTTIAEIDAGLIKYSEDTAGQCIDDIRNEGCSISGFAKIGTSCENLFQGTVANAGACTISEVCVNHGNCQHTDPNCDTSTACCAGTCQVEMTAAIGGDCSTALCPDKAYCDQTTMKCTAQLTTAGATCTDFNQCVPPLYCGIDITMPTGSMGTCQVPPATGATCNPNLFPNCDDERDYCDTGTMKCTRGVAVGQMCQGANGASCVGYADCVTPATGGAGMCVAKVKIGATCMSTGGASCLGDGQCTSAACTLPPAGMTCK